jgi:hypothetical protein
VFSSQFHWGVETEGRDLMTETVTIAIVDNDWAMREAIKTLMETVELSAPFHN